MKDATRVVHAGLPPAVDGEPLLPGPQFAAPYHLRGDVEGAPWHGYGRDGNPTWALYEGALGELEGAEAVLFPSGMAAVSAVVLPLLKPGDVLVAVEDGYPGIRAIGRDHLEPRGVDVRFVPTREDALRSALDGAALVWVETPSNPSLDVLDLRALAADVHAAGALLAVDNTVATPLGQRPLDLGADLVMTSLTKSMTGHHDVLLGAVTTRDGARAETLRTWRVNGGAIPGAFEAWLAHRSLATLDVRLGRACGNALAVAEMLAMRDDIPLVRYPGLVSDPSYEVASRQMAMYGAVLGFDAGSEQRARAFLDAAELVIEATSFGGVHTTAERRARWGTDAIAPGYIRFSAGLEATDDLVADVVGALERTG